MRTQQLALALGLGLVAKAAPTTREVELCGPNTNCEVVVENGMRRYKFKDGHEPGTENYAKRAAAMRKRDDEGKTTKVTIGDTKVDVGCEAHVTPNFDGLWELCPEDGGTCISGSSTTREVASEGGPGLAEGTAEIKLTASGVYENKEERDHLVHAIKATVTEDTIDQVEREWSGNDRLSPGLAENSCMMNRFPNFIGVAVFSSDGDLDSMMEANLENEEDGIGMLPKIAHLLFLYMLASPWYS